MYPCSDDGIYEVILVDGAFDRDAVRIDISTELGELQGLAGCSYWMQDIRQRDGDGEKGTHYQETRCRMHIYGLGRTLRPCRDGA
jgi:hypothetical protein